MKKIFAFFLVLMVCSSLCACLSGGGSSASATGGHSWEITEEMKTQIRQDYYDTYIKNDPVGGYTFEDIHLIVVSHVEAGYAVFVGCSAYEEDWENVSGQNVADFAYYTPGNWGGIELYNNGVFNTLDGAYNLQHISYEEVQAIIDDYHAQFPEAYEVWKRMFGNESTLGREECLLDYTVNDDGTTCTITGMGACRDKNVVIPETINGYRVTAIGETAFWSQFITGVVMPDSVVTIGRDAFMDCIELQSVTFSNSLTEIGLWAFRNCEKLESVALPGSLTLIDGGVFGGCKVLTNIEFSGTKAQWEAIEKGDGWEPDSDAYTIYCNDGRITGP